MPVPIEFHVLQSDRESISAYVIAQIKARGIELKEGARQILIAKAIKAYRETDGNVQYMQTIVASEIALTPAMRRASDVIVNVCDNIDSQDTLDRLTAHFALQGIKLHCDANGYFIRVPKAYDVTEMRRKVRELFGKLEMRTPRKPRKPPQRRFINGKWTEEHNLLGQ